MSQKVYEIITERITQALEAGTVPWHKPWKVAGVADSNLISGKAYRGINVWLTMATTLEKGFSSPYWVTFKQCQSLGGRVKKGEKGTPIIFWNFKEFVEESKEGGEPKVKKIPMARYYTVFNADQCEGIEAKIPKPAWEGKTFNPIAEAEKIVAGFQAKPTIKEGGSRACYSPSRDTVTMPPREAFDSPAEYYSTLFHELTHSTGHATRLAREGVIENHFFGDESYSKEELVAEMGAAFLSGMAGIENATVSNSAAYIKHWLGALKNDKRLVITAAAQAQKAADLILGVTFDKQEEEPKGEDLAA
ncbi:MAG TPA: zincin-like metallopeptidase domain-containing protein [bacterium]|nr:zincin-like metallopeptidase domain-containing protein [bacterium]